ncbi:MAG: hypothetical protein LCH61_05070 [Proteobacteria bacterium]|nr:hypothetical protein [Pseudomonadota bacterium]
MTELTAAPMGNCCNGGKMEAVQGGPVLAGVNVPQGVEIMSPAFKFAQETGVMPLGNCCSGGSQSPAKIAGAQDKK